MTGAPCECDRTNGGAAGVNGFCVVLDWLSNGPRGGEPSPGEPKTGLCSYDVRAQGAISKGQHIDLIISTKLHLLMPYHHCISGELSSVNVEIGNDGLQLSLQFICCKCSSGRIRYDISEAQEKSQHTCVMKFSVRLFVIVIISRSV